MEKTAEKRIEKKRNRDVRPHIFPDITWKNVDPVESLDKIYKYVIHTSENGSNWYYIKRNHKRRMGVTIRYGAIFLTAFAGLYPLIITIVHNLCITTNLDPTWSAIAIGVAALLFAVDKFGGYTSAWIRYVVAGQNIDNERELFYLKWQAGLQKFETSPDSIEQVQPMIEECRSFLARIQTIISNETNQWVTEFQNALKNIEDSAKAAGEAAKGAVQENGAINLTVENGEKYAGGWIVLIDGVKNKVCTGTSAVISGLKPGIITVKVTGNLNGKDVSDEKAIILIQGSVQDLKLTLPV
jgi:hypothetical protein